MIAYFAKGAGVDVPRDIPVFARLMEAGPWSCTEYQHPGEGSGAFITWADRPLSLDDARRATWRRCKDGLWYCRGPALPDQGFLAKRSCPTGIDVPMANGALLTIPLATASARTISFADASAGEPVTDFGRLATTVFDRMANAKTEDGKPKGLRITDPDVLRLVGLALMAAYRVTVELLDDLQWVSTADIDPIICAIMGTDPKALEPAGGPSPSPAGA